MIEGTLAPQGDSFDPAKATWAPILARTRLSANNAHKFDKLATVPPPMTPLPQSHHTAPVSLLWDNTTVTSASRFQVQFCIAGDTFALRMSLAAAWYP
jgi:hypothetical protein